MQQVPVKTKCIEVNWLLFHSKYITQQLISCFCKLKIVNFKLLTTYLGYKMLSKLLNLPFGQAFSVYIHKQNPILKNKQTNTQNLRLHTCCKVNSPCCLLCYLQRSPVRRSGGHGVKQRRRQCKDGWEICSRAQSSKKRTLHEMLRSGKRPS